MKSSHVRIESQFVFRRIPLHHHSPFIQYIAPHSPILSSGVSLVGNEVFVFVELLIPLGSNFVLLVVVVSG